MAEDWKSVVVSKIDFDLVGLIFFMGLCVLIPIAVFKWHTIESYLFAQSNRCWEVKNIEGRDPFAFNSCTGESKPLEL